MAVYFTGLNWLNLTSVCCQQAEDALKHYKGYTGESVTESIALKAELERLKVLANDRKVEERISLSDFG